jgi:ABC-type antimicrobial peptide transport system permease subunit
MLKDLCRAGVEGMMDMSGSAGRREMYKDLVASILSLVIAIIIVAFVGKYLWNTTVAELFTIARPVHSVWQIIGLMILLSLFR